MFSFKKKILVAGIVCLIPSYIMGSCQKRGNIISCQGGGSTQLRLTSKETEIYNTNMEIFDEVLNNSDNINQAVNGIRTLLSLGKEIYDIVKSSESKINGLKKQINSVQNQLNRASSGREQLERKLSGLINQKFNEQQYFVQELTSLKQRYRTEVSQLRNSNSRLNSLIKNSSSMVSSSLANKFSDYTECLSHNEVLKNLVFREREIKDNSGKSNSSYFSSSSGSYISNYSNFISTLSRFSISRNSLYSCAEDFKDLNRQFRLYDVTLGLIVNHANRASISHLFIVYRNQEPSSTDVTNFLRYFHSAPKYSLQELSDSINSYMLSH
jgi:hypothetical protein